MFLLIIKQESFNMQRKFSRTFSLSKKREKLNSRASKKRFVFAENPIKTATPLENGFYSSPLNFSTFHIMVNEEGGISRSGGLLKVLIYCRRGHAIGLFMGR